MTVVTNKQKDAHVLTGSSSRDDREKCKKYRSSSTPYCWNFHITKRRTSNVLAVTCWL